MKKSLAKKDRKKYKDSRPNNEPQNGIAKLIKELWQAAVNLRGSIEPADYKRYVLPIIFLRFLSLKYEKRRSELQKLVDNSKESKAILDDPDEYRSVGAFVVPPKARWDYILANAQANNIKTILDDALELLEKTYKDKLRGLLPRIFAGSNLDKDNVAGLINLFSKDIFKYDHDGEDLIGRVYEYFIGEFANSEGKRGGEYFTPSSIVKTLVAMLEPEEGIVYDPCCGCAGMFVQSHIFTKHNHKLSFVGQESKDFTYRLCRMNLFIHGLDGNIQLGNSYHDDKHSTIRADFILANPPFNDGAKSESGWGANRIADNDPRFSIDSKKMSLAPRNANTMWIMHFLYHLKNAGTAGFVMATGELSNREIVRLEVRRTLLEMGYVDCVVQLSKQLFANTQIPCSLWLLSKNRNGINGFRKRQNEVLFIDGRKLGSLIPGSRKQKQLSSEEIEKIANVYREFKIHRKPKEVLGFCKVQTFDEIKENGFVLTPGYYIGAEDLEEDDEPFEEKLPRLTKQLEGYFAESSDLMTKINRNLKDIS